MTLETNELKDNQIESLNKQIMQIKLQKENFQKELEITNLNFSDAKRRIKHNTSREESKRNTLADQR
jgi:hypothetical protein